MRALALAACATAAITACRPAPAAAPAPAAPTPPSRPQPATHVVVLEPLVATPVTQGPFIVRSINPGSDLQLAISKRGTCDDDVVWFVYSGGGTAVGAGETLCAASRADAAVTHGFSGHD